MTASPAPEGSAGGVASVVFFGSGAFAVPILESLVADPSVRVVGVVTAPDRPAGRGGPLRSVPIAKRAAELALPVLQPTSLRHPATEEAIRRLAPTVGVLADFGRIVPPAILAIPPRGILNVHPSLLPRHRGASPVAGAILAGDRETGVAVMAMDAGLDTGPVVAVERWQLAPDATTESEERVAAERGAALLGRVLHPWVAGTIEAEPQDDAAATLTRPLRREDGRLDPTRPAQELERRVRALRPWPGTFLEVGEMRVAVLESHVAPAGHDDVAGHIVADGRGLALATGDGRLVLDRVQPAGGRPMRAEDLRRGYSGLVGTAVRRADDGGMR